VSAFLVDKRVDKSYRVHDKMGDGFFVVVRKKENSVDYCALEPPPFLVGKGKHKAAGDK